MNEKLKLKLLLAIFPPDLLCFFTDETKKTLSEISRTKNTATNLQEMLRRKYKTVRSFKTTQYLPNIPLTPTVDASIPDLDTFSEDLKNDAMYGAYNEFATKLMDAHSSAVENLETLCWDQFLTEEEFAELEAIKKIPKELEELKKSLATDFARLSDTDSVKGSIKYLTQNEVDEYAKKSIKPDAIIELAKKIQEHEKLRPKEVEPVIFDEEMFKANILSPREKFDSILHFQTQSAAGNYILNKKQNSRDPRNFLYEISNEDYIERSEEGKNGSVTVFKPALDKDGVKPYVAAFYDTQSIHNFHKKAENGLLAKVDRAVKNERRRLDAERQKLVDVYDKQFREWNDIATTLNNEYRTLTSDHSTLLLNLSKEYRELSENRRKKIVEDERNHNALVSTSIDTYKAKATIHSNEFNAFFEKLGVLLPEPAFEIYTKLTEVSKKDEKKDASESEKSAE
jgi:hypothetical protein